MAVTAIFVPARHSLARAYARSNGASSNLVDGDNDIIFWR
jgi:hypothetical protein